MTRPLIWVASQINGAHPEQMANEIFINFEISKCFPRFEVACKQNRKFYFSTLNGIITTVSVDQLEFVWSSYGQCLTFRLSKLLT